ncbi:glycoside hydrolase family 32 protein [Flavivirga sp. 57AJ16]|uniref:glycoside hydrolase family 32 protein n=1 Tax=Flavivirga sp. 57AJ16 TaxID=3025307 RepID=UPI0023667E15|nr:glycoside hydrolase family 32 protein [Flavivirga sp. 57AJ16]MDD7885146.1 glycoside hydrolase family 32 protein [Flavivirga sp. 57AJ16]
MKQFNPIERAMKCILVLCVLTIFSNHAVSANLLNPQVSNKAREIKAQKKWLLLPVKNGAQKKKVAIFAKGVEVCSFSIELADSNPDWYAYLDIRTWKGENLEILVNELSQNSLALTLIKQSDKELDKSNMYAEDLRGKIHFSPKRGWNNDPNGLTFYNGEYHMFFQHNPYGVQWGNMHWGHAISKDLVHWKEVGEALYPDETGTMYSGSGVVDKNNTSGFGTLKNAPMVVSYTSDKLWTQGLAYSLNGKDFTKFEKPVVKKVTNGNRDPKIVWYEPLKEWIMVLYVEKPEKQHTVHFYGSKNLKDWSLLSILKGGKDNDRFLFECPDFYELPVDGYENNKKWVLSGANSEYAIGTFDGKTFQPELSRLKSVHGRGYYAAQTFSNDPKGRIIEVGWWQTNTAHGENYFNQSMSLPMALKLVTTTNGLRLSRKPVEELESLRKKQQTFKNVKVIGKSILPLKLNPKNALEVHVELESDTASEIVFKIRGLDIVYNFNNEELIVDGVKEKLTLKNGQLKFTAFIDKTGVEIFADNGVFYMPVNVNITNDNEQIILSSKEGATICRKINVYSLKSIW